MPVIRLTQNLQHASLHKLGPFSKSTLVTKGNEVLKKSSHKVQQSDTKGQLVWALGHLHTICSIEGLNVHFSLNSKFAGLRAPLSSLRLSRSFLAFLAPEPGGTRQLKISFVTCIIKYNILGEGSHVSTNQRRETTVFSLLIG